MKYAYLILASTLLLLGCEPVVDNPEATPAKPESPSNLSSYLNRASFILNWSEVENTDQYHLYWSTNIDEAPTKISNVEMPYQFTGHELLTDHYFWISAENESGESDASAVTSIGDYARTIVIVQQSSLSIEDNGDGTYQVQASAIVTDRVGNPVVNGTRVYIDIFDTVLAQGRIGDQVNETIQDSTLTDQNPSLGDDQTITTFDTAYAQRDGNTFTIEKGDAVLFTSLYDEYFSSMPISSPQDNIRTIDNWNYNSLTVIPPYSHSYPSDTYPMVNYVVVRNVLGAKITGDSVKIDPWDNSIYVTTLDGIATFYANYPATDNALLTGCNNTEEDDRIFPIDAARIYLTASAARKANTINDRFCFWPLPE